MESAIIKIERITGEVYNNNLEETATRIKKQETRNKSKRRVEVGR